MNAEAIHFEFRNLCASLSGAAQTTLFLVELHNVLATLLLLRFLDHYTLIGVANAFALVGLRRTEAANLGATWPTFCLSLPVTTNLRLARRFDADAFRHVVDHRMREAERQVELVALRLRAIANADQARACARSRQ